LRYGELVRKLRRLGFRYYGHAKGSHELWWLPKTERRTVITRHATREIPPGTLRSILRDLELTEEDLRNA
jgi:predicted RNA binding protein YcfA (HicA-like mRNA interferase family)